MTLLFQGPSKGGLYPWPTTSPKSFARTTFVGERVSINHWHRHLGHPATPLVRQVVSKNRLPVLSNKPTLLCPACQ
jgi:hypothetical protein